MPFRGKVSDIKRGTSTRTELFIFSAQPASVPNVSRDHICRSECYGKFWPKNPAEFLDWELDEDNVASRPPGKGKHQSAPIAGRHVAYVGMHKDKRGSDLVERIYCAFEVLRSSPRFVAQHTSGKGGRTYAIERLIAARLGKKLGQSRRGRRRAEAHLKFMPFEKTGTVYSLWRSFRARHPHSARCPDPVVARHLNLFWRVRNFGAEINRARRHGDVSEATECAIARRIMEGSSTGALKRIRQSCHSDVPSTCASH
jgi:hypothetical protein